jgi:hypothetical protein
LKHLSSFGRDQFKSVQLLGHGKYKRCGTKIKRESSIGQIQRQNFLRTDVSESIASTLGQSVIHTAKASLSDTVNWNIATPATLTGIVTVGLAGGALKLQRNGIESQEQQLSATKTMVVTLQQIKQRLDTL